MQIDAKAAGMSADRLNRISKHLRSNYIDTGKIAGCLPMVFRRGQLAYFEPFGQMDLERGTPMSEDTVFRIYSMSKPITSVALMMLYEEGAFQLNDPVTRFIPQWRNLGVYSAGVAPNFAVRPLDRPMFIRDLFTHMSGLTYDFMARTNVDHAYRRLKIGRDPGDTLDDMIGKLAEVPLEFSPGTAWNYSVATDVLGHLVEVISGQRFDQFLQERIFTPLGMPDTGFQVADSNVSRFAANYVRAPDKSLQLEDDPETSVYTAARKYHSGGGGLVSTAHDYLRFTRMLLGGGELDGVRILGPKTVDLMTRNYLPGNDDLTRWAQGTFSETANEGYGFGLGFSINLGPERTASIGSAGEYAWGGAASTIFWVDPAEELIAIFMTQFMPSGTFNFRGQLKNLVYQAIVE